MILKIALDFDQTYTADMPMWDQFIDLARARNHDVRIVTFRDSTMRDHYLDKLSQRIPVIYTEAQQKRRFCADMGWFVDIWIDDSPEFIVEPQILFVTPGEQQ
jgi:hypothetical protein